MPTQCSLDGLARRTILRIDRSLDHNPWRIFARGLRDLDVNIAIATIGPGELYICPPNDDQLQFASLARVVVLRVRALLPGENFTHADLLRLTFRKRNVLGCVAIVCWLLIARLAVADIQLVRREGRCSRH